MECPHCHQPLAAGAEEEPKLLTCASCGQKALPGANFCSQCGHQLPAPPGEEPKLLTCASCGQKALPPAHYCPNCGEALGQEMEPEEEEVTSFEPGKRIACSDGLCIGIIGPDGKCTECGKPYTGPPDGKG